MYKTWLIGGIFMGWGMWSPLSLEVFVLYSDSSLHFLDMVWLGFREKWTLNFNNNWQLLFSIRTVFWHNWWFHLKYQYVLIAVKCISGPSSPNKPSSQLNVCEGQRGNIQCPGNKYIKINGATYGRTDRTTCPDPRIKTTECSTDKPLSMIRDQCQGQQECTVTSSNTLYGDPCVNTYKYLTVNFDCTGKTLNNKSHEIKVHQHVHF